MDWKKQVEKWENYDELDKELKKELESLSEKELEDAFYKNLEFGTGGMRGEIGVGTNRMNIYTVRKASAGLGAYVQSICENPKERSVVIAYDSRHKSKEFAMEAAKTLATMGIKTYVFDELRPTPELSFAVRHLKATAGIVITASHNPPEYNGYKVYGPDGGQLPPKQADMVIFYVNQIENELEIEVNEEEELRNQGLIQIIGKEVDEAYLKHLLTISENPHLGKTTNINIVYTPLHGTGNQLVRKGLQTLGYKNVHIVKEQEMPDPNFSTVKSPNPEELSAFELAIKKGKEVEADLLIATDPDADRLGIVVKDGQDNYIGLTGNQTGAILLHYILTQKQLKGTLPENGVLLKTIVTSELGRKIASSYGVETVDVLTGFKFIAEKMKEYEETNKYQFLFGYEESYGYLIGDFARDKDAVQAAILVAEVCAFYKEQGKSLYEALYDLYEQYGYYQEGLESITLKGKEGSEQIERIMESFRQSPLEKLGDQAVVILEDYLQSKRTYQDGKTESIHLPKSNVLKYFLADESWICLRPSGTEPKIKFYFSVCDHSLEKSKEKLTTIKEQFMKKVENILNK